MAEFVVPEVETEYIDVSDLERYYTRSKVLEIAHSEDDSEEYDGHKLQDAIQAAEESLNEHCRRRYVVPLSKVSPRIRQILCYMAYKNLYDESFELPVSVQENNSIALEYLDKIADDIVRLDADLAEDGHKKVYGIYSNTEDVEGNARKFSEEF